MDTRGKIVGKRQKPSPPGREKEVFVCWKGGGDACSGGWGGRGAGGRLACLFPLSRNHAFSRVASLFILHDVVVPSGTD